MKPSDPDWPDLSVNKYGFEYGSACVERLLSDPKYGIVIRIYSATHREKYVDVRVSPGGQKVQVVS